MLINVSIFWNKITERDIPCFCPCDADNNISITQSSSFCLTIISYLNSFCSRKVNSETICKIPALDKKRSCFAD